MAKRKPGWILAAALAVVVSLVLVAGAFAQDLEGTANEPLGKYASAENNADYNAILLKARQFTPEPGGELSTMEESRHAIIQFEGQPQQQTLNALAGQGVDILQYVPRNAVMAYIPANTDLASIPGIRWVGAMQVTDKLSDYLQVSLDKGFVLVDTFPDISSDRVEEVINAIGGELVQNPYLLPNTYLVHADEGIVTKLSTADEVSWIWAASDAIIEGLPVYSCPGAINALGVTANYVVHDDGWDGPGQGSAALKYYFVNGTEDITGEEAEVERALNEWSQYAAITWTEAASSGMDRSIDIQWHSIDGLGRTLAYAYYPAPPNSEPQAGDIHFDEDESWNIGAHLDVFSIALHESGHSLGLGHSENPQAVLYPSYSGQIWTGLHQDDIDGIQSIYASAGGPTPTPIPTPTLTPPTISYSSPSFSFSAIEGGPNPSSENLGIWNSGGGTLYWLVSDNANWLTLSPTSGSSTGEVDNVTVLVNIVGMAAGDYNAIIAIYELGTTNTPQTVSVSLTIYPSTFTPTPQPTLTPVPTPTYTPSPTPTPTLIPTPQRSGIWSFYGGGFFPKHLPDNYYGTVLLAELNLGGVPDEVQGIYWWDGNEWLFWAPGVPETTLATLGGGYAFDYMVAVIAACEWIIPLP